MLSYAEFGLVAVAVGSSAYLFRRDKLVRGSKLPLPPSPAGSYPLIGHALALPTNDEHITYAKWCKELKSNIISLTALGQTIIIVNSAEIAIDLMDRRSTIYSDRPQLRVISDPDLLDWSYNTGSTSYGPRWKKQRRMTHDVLKSSVNHHHFALMEKETHAMIKRLLETPENFEKEFRRTVATEILSTVYGYPVTGSNDPLVLGIEAGIANFSRAALPGNFLVNLIPWLKYVPEWFPGAGWKRTIREWRQLKEEVTNGPFDWAKSQIAAGSAPPSMIKTHLPEIMNNSGLNQAEEEDYLKWAAATMFGAGADTTVATSMSFMLAMLHYPDVQIRAQAEIDSVTHGERLPCMNDRDSMPYLQCIVQEVLRWQPVLATGFPHASSKDDEYQGYLIPKGSIIIPNAWAMCRDESVYEDPETFNPDRFLDPSVPSAPIFGFGRRSCPGNHYAEASLFIIVASILAVFDIKPKVDPVTGLEMIPEVKVLTSVLVSHPLPFECLIKPRSDAHKELIGFA